MSTIITPTVGRKVWYRPSAFDMQGPDAMVCVTGQPLDATVIAVWGDRMVNLLVIDIMGKVIPQLSITLVQECDLTPMQGVQDKDGNPTPGGYAEWMPYQTKQAAKAST